MSDRWLTYEEAGTLFGLSPEAIRKRARRLGWRIQSGNDNQTKTRILVPDGAELRPAGPPPGTPIGDRPDDRPDGLVSELRRRAEAAEADRNRERAERERVESERERLAAELIPERERRARAEGETAALKDALTRERVHFEQALSRAERVEQEAVRLRDAVVRETARADVERGARKAAEAGRDIAQAAALASERRWEATEAVLASRNASNPLVRAWWAVWHRRR